MTKKSVNVENDPSKSSPLTIAFDNFFIDQPHNRKFTKKIPALDYLKNFKNLYLFSEDRTATGIKAFYTLDYDTIYQLSQKGLYYCLYENFESDDKIKLHIDIDIKLNVTDAARRPNHLALLNEYVDQCIDMLLVELEKYGITNPPIIVLDSCRPDKVSGHIIFVNTAFVNIRALKFFMLSFKSYLIEDEIVDMKIYRTGCFRLPGSSKYGKNSPLRYHKSYNYNYVDDKKLFMDCLIRNLPEEHFTVNIEVPENIKIVTKRSAQKGTQKSTQNGTQKGTQIELKDRPSNDFPVSVLKRFVDILDIKRADEYNTWLQVGMCLHGCNNSPECFNLWDKWSQSSESYDSRDVCAYKWNSFSSGYTIGTLKHLARADNPDKFAHFEYDLEKNTFESIKFTAEYLLEKDCVLKTSKSIVAQNIIKWLGDKTKSLAIASPYDTAKTTTIKYILKEYAPKRVLFVSYRQTLTYDLYGVFKEFGVFNYLDGYLGANKIICQVDSLFKLVSDFVNDDGEVVIPGYDLVVIDEIESVLAHFRSNTITEKERIFVLLCDIINSSKKVLALDGDFGNRSYDFLKYFGEPIILENQVRKNKKHFKFTNNKNDLEKLIDVDLVSHKNIVIVSMSSTLATYFYNKYNEQYKCVLHCSKSDDSLKEELKDVNSYWKGFQLICYSPTIEAGVNFDCDHVDKIYVALCSLSTSPRGLMQMISRVRKIKDSDIVVYLNNLPFKKIANFYKYDEVKEHIKGINKMYAKSKSVVAGENVVITTYGFSLYNKILVHNETEIKNKNPAYFVAYLIKLIEAKGHTYEVLEDKIKFAKKKSSDSSFLKEDILSADDPTEEEFRELMVKQRSNKATAEEKLMIEKHMYKKNWGIDTIDATFLDKYYGKTHILFNLRAYLDATRIELYQTIDEKDYYSLNFDAAVKMEQRKVIREVVDKLGFDGIGGTVVERDTFKANIEKVVRECSLFVNISRSQLLFGFHKLKIGSVKSFLGFFNSILGQWGLCIKPYRQNHRKKSSDVLRYNLEYCNEYDKYIVN
jgi:hypothetical protein